jgi:hypothetical protein
MRTPRIRFTVRTAMLAVAIIGIACGATVWGTRMLRLRSNYLADAARFARDEAAMRRLASQTRGSTARFNLKRAEIMGNMRLYYERLARYPWLPDDAGSATRIRRP